MWQKSGGELGRELTEKEKLPPLPESTAYIWVWFCKIGGDMSPMQIKAFFELQQIEPEPWEIDCLLSLDNERKRAAY